MRLTGNYAFLDIISLRLNFGHQFLICGEEDEHHCPQPKFLRSLTTDFLHFGQFLVISSLKNSTICLHVWHLTSNIASNPHFCQLFPVHFLIRIRSLFSSYNRRRYKFGQLKSQFIANWFDCLSLQHLNLIRPMDTP